MKMKGLVIAILLIAIIISGIYFAGFSGVINSPVNQNAITNPTSSPTLTPSPTTISNPTATPMLQPTTTESPPTATPKPYDFTVTYQQVERNTTSITLQVTFSNGEGQVVTVSNSEIMLTITESEQLLGRASSQIYATESVITVTQNAYTTTFAFQLNDFAIEKEANVAVIYGLDVGPLHAIPS